MMKNNFLRLVERFLVVADEGSIQGASRVLNISQPSLTLSISKIEEGFGARLFDRSKRGVALTHAGKLLYPRAKEILAQGAMAQREIDDLTSRQSGRFHIRAGSSWGYCFLPSIVAGLKTEFPDLDITFNIGNTDQAFPHLMAGEIDVIIGRADVSNPPIAGIGLTDLGEMKYVLVCSMDHHLASLQRRLKARDLEAESFVAYEQDVKVLKDVFEPLLDGADESINIMLRTRSPHAALEMVEAGNFLTCLSRPFVQKYQTDKLRILEIDVPLHRFRTTVLYRETLTLTDPFRSLMKRLKKASRNLD